MIVKDLENIEFLINQMDGKSVFDLSGTNHYKFKRTRNLDKTIKEISGNMKEEIQEYKRMADFRKDFIANISHELKTPIFAAQGFVHTLLDGAVKDKRVRERFLKKAVKSLDRLDLMVQDLLTLSQIEIGDIRMHFEYFDILKMCVEIFDQLEQSAGKKGIRLELIHDKKQFLVHADFRRIRQVMNNLIQNAIKYNRDEGLVQVKLVEEEKCIHVFVIDSGEGIEDQYISRIFERFYRVEKSRSRSKGGTGLGLSIVKHILEGHHSNIRVDSTPGKGSKFSFRLSKGKGLLDQLADK